MKLAIRIVAGLLALTVVTAVTASPLARPAVRFVRVQPTVVLVGTHFRARERVRLTLTAGATSRTRWARASATGAFRSDVGALPADFDVCNDSLLVLARGRTGDEATAKYVARECPPKP